MGTSNGARHTGAQKPSRGSRNGSRRRTPRGVNGGVSDTSLAALQEKFSHGQKPTTTTNQKGGGVTASQSNTEFGLEDECSCLNPACPNVFLRKDAYGTHDDGMTCCKPCEDIVDPYSAEIRRQRALS